jgi:catechol 2,3-dioxygenase-like lactoylglutathione lyase family enzyme
MQTNTVGDSATATTSGHGLESLTYTCTAVVVADLDRAIEWYGHYLGFSERARMRIDGANVALLEGAGTQLEFLQYDDGSVTTEPSLFAEPPEHLRPMGNKFLVFTVEDLERASDELESKGVPIIWRGKTLSPGVRSTAVRDLDGNFVHIVHH